MGFHRRNKSFDFLTMRIALAVLLFALVASAAASDYYRIDWDIMAEGTGSHVAGVVHRNDELEGNSNTYVVGSFTEQLAFTGDSILDGRVRQRDRGGHLRRLLQ